MKSVANTNLRKFKAKKTLIERVKEGTKTVIIGGLVIVGFPIVLMGAAAIYFTANKD